MKHYTITLDYLDVNDIYNHYARNVFDSVHVAMGELTKARENIDFRLLADKLETAYYNALTLKEIGEQMKEQDE